MTEQASNSVYDFESQLELGEMLLKLGRINEAELELRKARDLNAAGSYTLADDDPRRQDQLERLNTALDRVEEVKGRSERNTRLAWIAGTSLLGLLLGIVTVSLILGNNANSEFQEEVSATIEAIGTRAVQYDREQSILSGERTVYVENIKVYNVQLTEAANLARMGELAATQAAEYSERTATEIAIGVLAAIEGGAGDTFFLQPTPVPDEIAVGEFENDGEDGNTSTPTVRPRRTPITSSNSDDDISMRLQVTSGRANFRAGPGFAYLIQRVLTNDDQLNILGQSRDSFWYYVEAEDGVEGWLHASTSKPVELIGLPVIAGPNIPTAVPAVPVAPAVQSTNTPFPRPTLLPTNTPVTPPTTVPPAPTRSSQSATAVPFVPTDTPASPAVAPVVTTGATFATPTTVIVPTSTSTPPPNNTIAPTSVVLPTNTSIPPTNTVPPTAVVLPTNTATVLPTAVPPTDTPEPSPTPLPTKTEVISASPTAAITVTPIEVEFPPVATATPISALPLPSEENDEDAADTPAPAGEFPVEIPSPTPGLTFPPLTQP